MSVPFRKLEVEGNTFALSFAYSGEIKDAIKSSFVGRYWNAVDKTWRIPCAKTSPEVLQQFCTQYEFPLTADILAMATASADDEPVLEKLAGSLSFDGRRLFLKTSRYDERVMIRIKNIASRKWDVQTFSNTFSIKHVGEALGIARDFGFTVDEELLALLAYEGKTALYGVDGRGLIRTPTTSQDFVTISTLAGTKYSVKLGGFVFDATFLVSIMEKFPDLVIDESAKDLVREYEKDKELVALSRAIDYTASDEEWLALEGMAIFEDHKPFPYQMAAVEYIRRVRGVIVGDDMGVGKTLTALVAIHALKSKPALIVCPASAKDVWRKEIRAWIPDATVEVISGTSPIMETFDGCADFTIINYDILHAHQHSFSHMKSVVDDESHRLKSINARRTKAAMVIANSVSHDALRLCLSGTATPNRAEELISQLEVIGQMEKFGSRASFKKKYTSGDSLVELNNKLRQTCYVQRRFRDVAQFLPDLSYAIFSMYGSSAEMAEYRKCEADLIGWIRKTELEKRQRKGVSYGEAARQADIKAERAERAQGLVYISKLRQLSANAKMGEVASFIEEMKEAREKLITFGFHKHIVEGIAESFSNGLLINGTIKPENRQSMVDKFQEDENEFVISLQFPAANESLNITAAHNLLFVELPWNWATFSQSVSRSFRTGQKFPVTAHVPIIADTIDEYIWGVIQSKKENTELIQNGEASEDEIEDQSMQAQLLDFFTKKAMMQ